ncbi:hypothetical protein Acsp07_50510 [Actinomycetospora sp. NBRC 106378]|nr:hypothetical protein Acsp07_50510 [Actinomycetospora sp. NBRC 106378]
MTSGPSSCPYRATGAQRITEERAAVSENGPSGSIEKVAFLPLDDSNDALLPQEVRLMVPTMRRHTRQVLS